MPVVKLTPQFIENELQCPDGKKRIEYCDKELPGLYIEVRATSPNHGSFYLRYKDANGKTCHQKIGRTSDGITLVEARKQAKELKAEIVLGANPRREVKDKKKIPSFETFFEKVYMPNARVHKRSHGKDECMFRLRIRERFGKQRLDKINRREVITFHNELKSSGLSGATCDHHIKLMRRVLNYSVELQVIEKNNLAKIKLFNEDNRVNDRLSQEELDRLVAVLRAEDNPQALVFLFLLATTVRLNEALQARWADIDSLTRTWTIPASDSKSKRSRSIPLNDAALDILSQLDTEGDFEHLFINKRTGLRYKSVHKYWSTKIRPAAGLPDLLIHSLRRWGATCMVESGVPIYEIKTILGHRDISTTERYASLSATKLLQAASTTSARLMGGSV